MAQIKRISAALAVAALFAVSSARPAVADLQISQTTVIDCPGMKSLLKEIPEDKRAPLLQMMSPIMTGAPWVTTTWLKGSRMRTDMGDTTVVVNSSSGKQFVLNRQTRRYSIGAYDPFQKAAGSFTIHIAPDGRRSLMLGYTVDGYSISMTSSVLPKSPIYGELWAAPGLPTPPAQSYAGGVAAGFESAMSSVRGMPLAYRLVYKDTPEGDINVTSYATSIDSRDLPMEAFRIPADYQTGVTRIPTHTPSSGYPLGDGMPLDPGTVSDGMATGEEESSSVPSMPGADLSAGSGLSPQALQGLMGAGGGSSSSGLGAGSLQGMSPEMLNSMVGGLLGGGSAGGMGGIAGSSDLSALANPQMLQQLSRQLNSLLNDNGD